MERATKPVWWGEFELEEGASRFWSVGTFRLVLERGPRELRVTTWREGDVWARELAVASADEPGLPEEPELQRFGFRQGPPRITLTPRLADRPMVVQPEHDFYLPAEEEATIYVSSPLWVELSVPGGSVLTQWPIHRPSDTWFGPNTRVGEIAYASRTAARVNLAKLAVLPQRAISAVRIENRADSVLEIERLRLPAPNLSLHVSAQGHLWTEAVKLVREEDGDLAALVLEDTPPDEAGSTTFVSGPRQKPDRATPLRSFGRMLRKGVLHG